MGTRFAIVTAAWQCERWIARTIGSLRAQTYGEFRAVVIDDQSQDRSYARALEAAADDPRISVIRSDRRVGALANIVRGTALAAQHDDVPAEDAVALVHLCELRAGSLRLEVGLRGLRVRLAVRRVLQRAAHDLLHPSLMDVDARAKLHCA